MAVSSNRLETFPDHLLAQSAAYLDVQSFGSFGSVCKATASTCSMKDLDIDVLVRHVQFMCDSVTKTKSKDDVTLYEKAECFRIIEGVGAKPNAETGTTQTRVEKLKLAALGRLVSDWLEVDWTFTDKLVQEMFENAVMVNNLIAIDFLLRAKHTPAEPEEEEKHEEEEDGLILHFEDEEDVEEEVEVNEEERLEQERALHCLRQEDVELGLLHAAEKLNAELVWLLVKHPSAKLLVSAEGLTNAMVLAVTAGGMELTGCLLAHLFLRDIPRKQKNDAVAKAMLKAAEFGFPRLTLDLTNMLQFRTKLWQFRLAEERAERMREQEERVKELQAEVNSPFFRRRNNNQRSPEAIAREQAEIEARAVRDEREAVFGVKDFRQALEAVLNKAVMQKQIGVLEALFTSRISDEITAEARKRLFKLAIRRNDPEAGNSYIEVAKFFVLGSFVTRGNVIDLLIESVRRDAVYSVLALVEVNADPKVQFFSPTLLKSSLDMSPSEEMADVLRNALS